MSAINYNSSKYVIKKRTGLGCWLWKKSPHNHKGYGRVYIDGFKKYAHRYFYEIFNGPIPEQMQVDHLCRNTRCVNPAHLEVVTLLENLYRSNRDRKRK